MLIMIDFIVLIVLFFYNTSYWSQNFMCIIILLSPRDNGRFLLDCEKVRLYFGLIYTHVAKSELVEVFNTSV